MTNSQGWEEDRYWSDPAVQKAVGSRERVVAQFAHLGEEKRQREAEESARRDLSG